MFSFSFKFYFNYINSLDPFSASICVCSKVWGNQDTLWGIQDTLWGNQDTLWGIRDTLWGIQDTKWTTYFLDCRTHRWSCDFKNPIRLSSGYPTLWADTVLRHSPVLNHIFIDLYLWYKRVFLHVAKTFYSVLHIY